MVKNRDDLSPLIVIAIIERTKNIENKIFILLLFKGWIKNNDKKIGKNLDR